MQYGYMNLSFLISRDKSIASTCGKLFLIYSIEFKDLTNTSFTVKTSFHCNTLSSTCIFCCKISVVFGSSPFVFQKHFIKFSSFTLVYKFFIIFNTTCYPMSFKRLFTSLFFVFAYHLQLFSLSNHFVFFCLNFIIQN